MRTQQEINKEWSDNSENYSAIIDDELNSFRAEAWRRKILEQVPSGKKLKILDTGCGPGFFTILLSLAGHEVIGIDGAEGMLLEAERKAAAYGVHPEFRAMDCHHLKPEGILLIFDANWHLMKTDPAVHEESLRRQEACVQRYGDAFDTKTKNKEERRKKDLEGEHVLGTKQRPDWDLGLLEGLGYVNICTERDITEELWDEKEQLLYGNTPMFMIRAEKP